MGAAERRKGRRGERELLAALRHALDDALVLSLNHAQAADGGLDILGLEGVAALEVKRCERPMLGAWLKQARAGARPGEVPAVAYRASRAPWRIVLELDLPGFASFLRTRIDEPYEEVQR